MPADKKKKPKRKKPTTKPAKKPAKRTPLPKRKPVPKRKPAAKPAPKAKHPERKKPPKRPKTYAQRADASNAYNAQRSRTGRDIAADYPEPGDSERRAACELDLRKYLSTYHAWAFPLPFSDDQLAAIDTLQTCILHGGLFALAMPRGSGKTAYVARASIWAKLYGHRRFLFLIGATLPAAKKILRTIKMELLDNELLAEDFRQVCYPIRCLENNGRRCNGQTFNGERTRIDWSDDRLTLPTMPDDACDGKNVSGSTVMLAGLTGAIRGPSHTLPSGEIIRPDLVLLDDPSTRESAMSSTQSAYRGEVISGDVLGLAGPGKKIAAVMPCTVIRAGDLADVYLDRARNPQWQGRRTKAIYSWPTNRPLWEQYHKLRRQLQRDGKPIAEATDFYRTSQAAMDEGARVAWLDRFNPDEISAVQYCEDLRQDIGEAAFAAEYENDPFAIDTGELPTISAKAVAEKCSGIVRGMLPLKTDFLSMFIDVHDSLLVWAVGAWRADFTGSIVSYGTYPEQPRSQWTLRKATPTLADVAPGAGREGAIFAGLNVLCGSLLSAPWRREDGAELRIGRCLVDAGYVPDLIFNFCRNSKYAAQLLPSRGYGIGATKAPMDEWPEKPGEHRGWRWLIGYTLNRVSRVCKFDANHWKSFVHARLAVALGDPGSLTLWGKEPDAHRLIAEQITAEAPIRVSANGRTVDEWRMRPGFTDNHWLDVCVGCAVAGSILGAKLPDVGPTKPKRQQKSLDEMREEARRAG